MKNFKILTIVGTRPELIKLSRVIAELDKHMNHFLVHTGQNYDYELNEIFFSEMEIRKPDHYLNIGAETVAKTIANVIEKSDEILAQEQPDAILILGDTNSCLCAIPAKRRKIPIFHMEAGNRCFDQRVPEEINRKIVDHISDVNLTYTEHARRYLVSEGVKPELVIKTGSPMKEVIGYYREKILASDILAINNLTEKEYFVVSAHREENVDCEEKLTSLLLVLKQLYEKYNYPIIFSTHPRTRNRLEASKLFLELNRDVTFIKPLGLFDYLCLQKNSSCVLSDSGTLTEEASLLNFPAVMIRDAHERPEGMDEAILLMANLQQGRVLHAISTVMSQSDAGHFSSAKVADYQVDNVSSKMVRIILSYTDFVNKKVWFK